MTAPPGTRLNFLDHLRVVLTALVVFHHAAITYGAPGGWYLREVAQGRSPGLDLFVTCNQAFFMGFFFLIAGYFTPPAYDRKGAWRFAADRLLRLGLPLLVFGFVLDALTDALARGHGLAGVFTIWGRMMARGWFSSGPLWFAQLLLNFAAIYVLWRLLHGPARGAAAMPGHRAILLAAIATGGAAFLLRLACPVGMTVSNLQPGYFASYVLLFAVGVAAVPGHWLERVSFELAWPWLVISALALSVLLVVAEIAGGGGFDGGWSVKAAVYAFFEPFFAWGVILGLLWLFRTRFNGASRAMSFLSARAYTVYIIHPPVLVGVALALRAWEAPAVAKFLAAGTLACAGCVALASAILSLPGARRIL